MLVLGGVPNLHFPHLHQTLIYTNPDLHQTHIYTIQIYTNPFLDIHFNKPKFTQPKFTQNDITSAYIGCKTQFDDNGRTQSHAVRVSHAVQVSDRPDGPPNGSGRPA